MKKDMIPSEKNLDFILKEDSLNRNNQLNNFIRLLNSINTNYIISIDGNWGNGKTFFVKSLEYLNESNNSYENIDKNNIKMFKEKYHVLYYNAWAYDDHEDVVETVILDIIKKYPKYANDLKYKNQDKQKIVTELLSNFVEKSSFGLLSKDLFSNFKSLKDIVENVTIYEEKKESLDSLLNVLIGEKRLLLIIDELDRCRPNYAVKVLETIKHFYNNDSITIVVSTNNSQLSEIIKHFYGYNLDGYSYLNKIYDSVIYLDINNRRQYLEKICKFNLGRELYYEMVLFLMEYYNFSLRECNSFIDMFNISKNYIHLSDDFHRNKWFIQSSFYLIIGIALKIKNISEYQKFVVGKSDDLIKNIIDSLIKKDISYNSWMRNLVDPKNERNDISLNEMFLEEYHDIFDNNQQFYKYPFLEALSMIGNKVEYNINEKTDE